MIYELGHAISPRHAKPTYRMNRTRAAPALLLLASLLLAADTLAWLGMQRLLDHRLGHLERHAQQSGWHFDIASGTRGGWPLAATLTLSAPRLHGADTLVPGGITWSGERIVVVFSPVHPRRITILAGGTQTISAGEAAPLVGRSLRFWGAETALHLPTASSRGRGELSFDAGALHVALPGAGPDDVLTVAGLDGTLRWNEAARALRVGLHGIGLPHSSLAQPSGAQSSLAPSSVARTDRVAATQIIPAASLELSLIGSADPHAGDLAARIRAWRDGGGRVLLRQASLDWSDATIEASGQASLDGNFQPDGAFSVRMKGADAVLDRLVRSGRITQEAAGAMRAVIGLIGAARDAGPKPGSAALSLELPLELRGGTLLLGQIPLLRIRLPDFGASPIGAQP